MCEASQQETKEEEDFQKIALFPLIFDTAAFKKKKRNKAGSEVHCGDIAGTLRECSSIR